MEKVRDLYFSLEDKYYAALDSIESKVPVYSIVDPVDRLLPSFGILLALGVSLFVFLGFSALGGLGGPAFQLTFTFTDESGSPLEGVEVHLQRGDEEARVAVTNDSGQAVFSAPAGAYTLNASKDGFKPFAQPLEVMEDTSVILSLQSAAPPVQTRNLLIQDAQNNILGLAQALSISLSFSCQSGSPPAPQTVANGTVSILQPVDCLGLSVSVSALGFVSKTQLIVGDNTVIVMQSDALLDGPSVNPVTGNVEVYARDAVQAGIAGAQAKLYKVPAAGSNVLANQSLTDGSGFALFSDMAPGQYVVIVSKSGFKQTTSAQFQVDAGATQTINLVVAPSSTRRKVLVKVLSAANQLPVSGAEVDLHVLNVFGKYVLYDSFTSDANGLVNQPLADFNGNTTLVVKASHYVTQISPGLGVVSEDEDAPANILLDPVDPANANGSIPNAAIVDVKAVDPLNLPIGGASVNLFFPDANGVLVDALQTNASGLARFANLPAASYQATASTSTADGLSPKLSAGLAQILQLPIVMDVGNALIEVTVRDEQNHVLADANVQIINNASRVVLAAGQTNAQGVVQLGAATGQSVFVRVSKTNYLSFSSVPFDVIKDNTHHISIEVGLTAATQQVDISLDQIFELTQGNGPVPAQTLVPGNTYAFHFSVRSPTSQSSWKAMARVNPNTPASLQPNDVGQILGAQAALGGVSFFTAYNPLDEFAPSGPVNSGVPAKVSLDALGDVNGAGAWEYIILVKINPAAVANVDKLELRYQSKSSTQTSPLYQSSYTLGQPLPAQGDFAFLFFLAEQGTTAQVQVSPALPIAIEQNKNYVLTYAVANLSGSNYPTASLSFGSSAPSTFTVSPNSANLPGFTSNAVVSGTTTLKSTSTCSSSVPYCTTLNVLLSNVGSNHSPTSAALQFYTAPEKRLFLSTTPSFLIPALVQVVQAVATDNAGNPLTPSQNVQISGQLQDASGAPVGSPISFTGNNFGVFVAAIPASSDGYKVVVTASAAGYLSDAKTIPITTDLALNFSQDFTCLAFNPSAVSFQMGAVGALNVQTNNCPEALSLYTSGFSENGQTIELSVKNGTANVNSNAPLAMNATDSKSLVIISPPYIGQYPLYVWAKYASESQYSLVRNIDVTVAPLAGSTQCLNVSKYAFNLTNGSDVAAIQNNCNPKVPDPFLPGAQLSVNGVYTHAVPALTSPEMRAAHSPLSFNWSVRVDYNGSNNFDVNHADFAALSAPDGNWYRYATASTTGFVPEKSFFAGVSPVMVSDAADSAGGSILEISTSPQYSTAVKSLLYESTFLTPNTQTLFQVCVQINGITTGILKLDGQQIASASASSSTQTACGSNVFLSPGPHAIQLFLNDTAPGAYYIKVYYKKTNAGSPSLALHNDFGLGFWLSPLLGIPASNDLQSNAPLALGPFIGTLTPATDSHAPKYLYTLTGPIRDVAMNTGGIDHLKQAYVQAWSDNPQVRVFLHDADVYAQFIGIDDPAGPQNVLVENLGMSGEKYGVLALHDYITPSGGVPVLDVGVLLDASPSMFAQELENNPPSSTPVSPYVQNGLCRTLNDLERALEFQSGVLVNLKLFLMSAPSGYHKLPPPNLPCAAYNPVVLPPFANPPQYDASTDDKNESWPLAAQAASNDAFWQSPNRVMVIVSDNKPYGLGPGALPNAWKGSAEQELVNAAAAALNAKNIRAVSWYKTPLESIQAGAVGDSSKNDAIEMMDSLAAQTNGFVEAVDFSEFVPSSAANAQHPFALAQNNRFAARLLQSVFDVRTENIVVKLTANPIDACVSEDGKIGSTGADSLPKILFNWSWANVNLDVCDSKPAPNTGNFRYCDAAQFTVSLVKKLRALELAYQPDANASARAQIPFLTNFDAYLIRDAYNSDFRSDFVEFFVNSSFADAPAYFKNSVSGAWKDYVDPGFSNLDFTIDGQPSGTQTLPSSGLYRVQVAVDWLSDPGTFFVASSPSANIHVKLTRLADAHALSNYSDFYDMPLDGLVGVDVTAQTFHRDRYGTAFTGGIVDLVQTPGYALRSYPSQTGVSALNTLNLTVANTFVGLNAQDRGTLVKLDMANAQIVLRPSLPAPVLVEWSTNTFGQGDVYYGIQETDASGQTGFVSYNSAGNPPLAKWTPLASTTHQSTLGCTSASCSICLDGGAHPYSQSAVPDSNPTSASCNLRTPLSTNKAFGFTSLSGAQNDAYLGTVFYRVPQNNYSILLGCNDSPTHEIGQVRTLNGTLANGTGSVSVLDLGSTGLETTLAPAQTLFGMLNLVDTQWTCVASSGGQTSVYWNAPKLRGFLGSQSQSFGQLSGNACVATGNPLSGAQVWMLNEHVSPLNVTPSNSAGYCGLYNANSTQGYYHQSGTPYPIGTQINIGSAVSPSTDDGLNALVQYRSVPTGCVPAQGGYPSCLGAGSQNYCASNTVRIWEGVPNIQP